MKCCQLIKQHLLAAECSVFGDNSATEFCRISQIMPRNLAKIGRGKNRPCSQYYKQYKNKLRKYRDISVTLLRSRCAFPKTTIL